MRKIYIFTAFERFWHWAQAILMVVLLATGFEIHGSWQLIGFQKAVDLHQISAVALIILWLFAIFWHFTTGQWRQYIPTSEKLTAMIRYYFRGVFKGEEHPFKPTVSGKHNPLQRLAYLVLKVILHPLIWITGMSLLLYPYRHQLGMDWDHEKVVNLHLAGAFLILSFLIAHLYLITTGHKLSTHMKAMLTGYEEVED